MPGEGSLRDLLDYAAPLAMQGFDRARPLWELTVVEGMADANAALIQKVHHSVTDGVGSLAKPPTWSARSLTSSSSTPAAVEQRDLLDEPPRFLDEPALGGATRLLFGREIFSDEQK